MLLLGNIVEIQNFLQKDIVPSKYNNLQIMIMGSLLNEVSWDFLRHI